MIETQFIKILIAEDNDISREMMVKVLQASAAYKIVAVRDGGEAIDAVSDEKFDLALVDLKMLPLSGFDFMKHLLAESIDLPCILITADQSTDLLVEANNHGAMRVLQKPVDPKRLVDTVQQALRRRGLNPSPMGVDVFDTKMSPEKLMERVIELAHHNASSGQGGPFGALITDQDGKILGEGTNGIASRVDPTAHAEVMAIRHAAEKLGRADLHDCVLYCSSEPTAVGKALIASVGIGKVYYGLTHDDVRTFRGREIPYEDGQKHTDYQQLSKEAAANMIAKWR